MHGEFPFSIEFCEFKTKAPQPAWSTGCVRLTSTFRVSNPHITEKLPILTIQTVKILSPFALTGQEAPRKSACL